MSQQINLQEVELEARRTFSQDGLIYLFTGILLSVVGLSLYDVRFSWLNGFVVFLFLPLELVRQRITYPRVGYARLKVPKGTVRGILGFAAVAVTILALVALAGNGRYQRYLPLVISLVFALSFYFGISMEGQRVSAVVFPGLVVLGGAAVSLIYDDWHVATAVLFWSAALILILFGTAKSIHFMRQNPVVKKEIE
jgi:hypothetical protein